MKKILVALLAAACFFLIASYAHAAPVSWDGNVGTNVLQPLQSLWTALVKGSRFQATSTTQASIFPLASTTAITTDTIFTDLLRADTSAGTVVQASNGTPVSILGAGNTANSLFYGGVNIDGATRLATSLTGFLKGTSGVVSAVSSLVPGDMSLTKGNFLVGNDAGVAQATSTVFISSTGQVGIDNTSPASLLHVGDGGAPATITIQGDTTSADGAIIDFKRASGTTVARIADIASGPTGGLHFYTNGTVTDRLSILDSGNVGINLASPSYKLDVAGFINTDQFSGYRLGGNLLGYASTTNGATIWGLGAGGNDATTTATNRGTTAFGYQALKGTTGAPSNSAFGYQAGAGLTTGDANTFIGYQAGESATSSVDNTFVGKNAGVGGAGSHTYSANGGNTGIGADVLDAITTGYRNTAIGSQAHGGLTTGDNNTAIGYNAAIGLTTGSGNFAMGSLAAQLGTTGSDNVAVGQTALQKSVTGSSNVGVGSGASLNNVSATNTVAIGWRAGYGATGYYNQGGTYVGYQAGRNVDAGSDYNTLIGHDAGYAVTTGQYNTMLGYFGTTGGVTTGSNNILIGKDVRAGLTVTSDNQLNIGNLIFGTGNGTGTTLGTGSIGIGTSTPTGLLQVAGATPKIVLSDTGATTDNKHWFMQSTAGTFKIGTTSDALVDGGVSALAINRAGFVALGGASNSNNFNVSAQGAANASFEVGIGSGVTFQSYNRNSSAYAALSIDGATINFRPGGVQAVHIDASGNVGVGTTTPFATLAVNPVAGEASNQFVVGSSTATSLQLDNSGHLFLPQLTTDAAAHTYTMCGAATTFEAIWDTTTCVLSAAKYKTNIADLDIGLDELMKIRPVVFNYKPTGDAAYDININITHQQIGVIADEVEKVDARLVTYDNKGEIKGFNYEQFTAWLAKSIQELNHKVDDNIQADDARDQKIAELEARLDALEGKKKQMMCVVP